MDRGQRLLTPVTDSDLGRPSYAENGEGFVLTAALMRWFWDHYADGADRAHPKAAPLCGTLAGLPPAVVTAEFDPCVTRVTPKPRRWPRPTSRVRQIRARGHIHTSLTMADAVISGAPVRAQRAEALGAIRPAPVRA
jgi:alpha/beta hydrolase fold